MPQQQTSNPAQVYEDFLGPSLFRPWAQLLIERASPREGDRVLDLACGTGIVTRLLPPLVGPSGRVVGVDINPDMLAVARSLPQPEGASIEWIQGNASELDLPPGSFDLVLCQQGLQFFPDRAAAVARIHNVLAPGGRAVIAVWQSLDRHSVLEALFRAEARHLELPVEKVATPFSLSDDAELRRLLHTAGFREVTVEHPALEVWFPSADRWVELTVRAGAAVIPELAKDEEAMKELLRSVQEGCGDAIRGCRDGDALAFPMYANLAVAHR